MSAGATEPGRTGRGSRREALGEAAPSERQPEDEEAAGEDANQIGAGLPIYFVKARGRELWHVYNKDDDQIGKCFRPNREARWSIKIDGIEVPAHIASFPAAVSAHAFVLGWAYAEGLLDAKSPTLDTGETEAGGGGGSGTAINPGPAVG